MSDLPKHCKTSSCQNCAANFRGGKKKKKEKSLPHMSMSNVRYSYFLR